jgi:IS30 family transposase
MRQYQQLTKTQRCQIEALKKSGCSQNRIATLLSISQSTVSREIKRNTGLRGYRHCQAHNTALQRRQHQRVVKMDEHLIDLIDDLLYKKWSPEQISGWLKNHSGEAHGKTISHERIYQHIWWDKRQGGDLYHCLRRRGKVYSSRGTDGKCSRGQIKNRRSIDERPAHVEERIEVGHWEIDTVIGKGHRGALVTIVERVTRFTVSTRVGSKSADDVTEATLALLRPYKRLVRSITADNGKEFSSHETIAKELGCDFYFAHPYHSWERGLNENTNGLLRQYFPKSTNFKEVSHRDVHKAVQELNQRPRKVLGFETPSDLMDNYLAAMTA